MYARDMTVHEIQGFLAKQYATEVRAELFSSVTEGFVAKVSAWQSRPLESLYPAVIFDDLRVTIRDEVIVRKKAIYRTLGALPDGTRDSLGLWIENT
jgi:putative transposase